MSCGRLGVKQRSDRHGVRLSLRVRAVAAAQGAHLWVRARRASLVEPKRDDQRHQGLCVGKPKCPHPPRSLCGHEGHFGEDPMQKWLGELPLHGIPVPHLAVLFEVSGILKLHLILVAQKTTPTLTRWHGPPCRRDRQRG